MIQIVCGEFCGICGKHFRSPEKHNELTFNDRQFHVDNFLHNLHNLARIASKAGKVWKL